MICLFVALYAQFVPYLFSLYANYLKACLIKNLLDALQVSLECGKTIIRLYIMSISIEPRLTHCTVYLQVREAWFRYRTSHVHTIASRLRGILIIWVVCVIWVTYRMQMCQPPALVSMCAVCYWCWYYLWCSSRFIRIEAKRQIFSRGNINVFLIDYLTMIAWAVDLLFSTYPNC